MCGGEEPGGGVASAGAAASAKFSSSSETLRGRPTFPGPRGLPFGHPRFFGAAEEGSAVLGVPVPSISASDPEGNASETGTGTPAATEAARSPSTSAAGASVAPHPTSAFSSAFVGFISSPRGGSETETAAPEKPNASFPSGGESGSRPTTSSTRAFESARSVSFSFRAFFRFFFSPASSRVAAAASRFFLFAARSQSSPRASAPFGRSGPFRNSIRWIAPA